MDKISDAKDILENLGLPKAQRNEISCLTLLALCGIKPNSSWSSAYRHSLTVTKGIMTFIKDKYGRNYAPNTRETFRRQVLHQFVQGGIVNYSPDNLKLPTNSPKAHYAISVSTLKVIKTYGTKKWSVELKKVISAQGSLNELYQKRRKKKIVKVKLPNDVLLELSPGKHNDVQAAIIKQFVPRFIHKPKVLYIGDTAKKNLYINNKELLKFGVSLTKHGKLPDVIIYDAEKKCLFLIEAVASHGPMNPKRIFELGKMFKKCKEVLVFVSAFHNFNEFKKYSKEISWETEVWIMEIPDHMIHYNGDKYLSPY